MRKRRPFSRASNVVEHGAREDVLFIYQLSGVAVVEYLASVDDRPDVHVIHG